MKTKSQPMPQAKKRSRRWLYIGIFLLVFTFIIPLIPALVFLLTYVFIARPFQITGEAMSPNYINGQYNIINVAASKITSPKYGDVIVFRAPTDANKNFIKRVIGIPGDRVMLQDGGVYINGQKSDESSYLATGVLTFGGSFMREGAEIVIPDENYLVMGDNRPFSSDSREWGFLLKKNIIGFVWFCYANCNTTLR